MATTVKFTALLIISVTIASLSFALYQTQRERRALHDDLSSRAEMLAASLQEALEPQFERGADGTVERLLARFSQREYVKGIAVYDLGGAALDITSNLNPTLSLRPPPVTRAAQADAGRGDFLTTGAAGAPTLYAYGLPLHRNGRVAGSLGLFLDADYIDARVSRTLRDSLVNAGVQVLVTVPLVLLLVRWNFTDPIIRMTVPQWAPREVNALQRASTIVLQKSLREGFGLTVAEALWKRKPVVASAVGGIPAQVIHKHTGRLAHSIEGTAYQIRFLLSHPEIAAKLGEQGHEHVKENFLITQNLKNYLVLFLSLLR
jgi:hypothetical protein